jgi:hypothetical protein
MVVLEMAGVFPVVRAAAPAAQEGRVFLEALQHPVKAMRAAAILYKRRWVLLAVAVVQVLLDQTALVTWRVMAAPDWIGTVWGRSMQPEAAAGLLAALLERVVVQSAETGQHQLQDRRHLLQTVEAAAVVVVVQ